MARVEGNDGATRPRAACASVAPRVSPGVAGPHLTAMRHAEIQERELIKLAALAAAATKALHARGVTKPIASLVAEAGVAVFKVGFERWMRDEDPRDFVGHIREAMAALRAAAAPTTVKPPPPGPKKRPARRA